MSQTDDRFDLATARLLSAIVTSSSDAIIGKSLGGIITSWNRGAERIFGYSAAEVVGESIALLFPSSAYDDLESILTRLRAGERVDRYTSRRRRKDGQEIDVSLTITPILDEEGNTVGAATIARDITEYLQTAEAFRYRVDFEDLIGRISTDFLNLSPEETDAGILDALAQIGEFAGVDRSYVFQFSDDLTTMSNTHEWCAPGVSSQNHRLRNAPLSALPGFTAQILQGEIVYVSSLETLPTDTAPEHAELAHQGIQSLVLVPMKSRDETIGFLGFDAVQEPRTWTDEAIRLLTFVGQIFVNALQRRRAAAVLREREMQYRRIFEATSDGLVITDLDTGVVLEANPAMCRMHGYSYDEFIGMQRTDYIHQDFHPHLARYLDAIKNGKEFRVRAVDVRKDGSNLHVEVNGASVEFQGKPAILGVVRDITSDVEAYELLEQRVAQRTQELSMLLQISENVTSTLQLPELLEYVMDHLKSVIDHAAASILIAEGDGLVMIGHRNHLTGGSPNEVHYPFSKVGHIWEKLRTSNGIILTDLRNDLSAEAMTFKEMVGYDRPGGPGFINSLLWTPLKVKGDTVGLFSITSKEVNGFSERDLLLANAIARHAAIAIENARLFEQAQGKAALEERQKLARELHDSVSQALYGIALGAQTARRQLERDPNLAIEPLDYVLSLAEGGLAEMRALIFELRPESLEAEGLVAALMKQTTALSARYRIDVALDVAEEPDVPLDAKETLYRIAQEAMHNTVKHAHATSINVRLSCYPDAIVLHVRDDGRGFDVTSSFPGHLGLQSMHERAVRIGGSVAIESTPGNGTSILARIPANRQKHSTSWPLR